MLLRHKSVEIGALHLVLACLSALSHQKPRKPTADNGHMELTSAAILVSNLSASLSITTVWCARDFFKINRGF